MLVVNQNYDPGWRSSVGRVRAHEGLLAVDLDRPVRQTLTLSYRSRPFAVGLAVSGVAWLVVSAAAAWMTYRRHRAGAQTREVPP